MFAHEPALNYYAERVAEPEPDLIDRSPKVVRTVTLRSEEATVCSVRCCKVTLQGIVRKCSFGILFFLETEKEWYFIFDSYYYERVGNY